MNAHSFIAELNKSALTNPMPLTINGEMTAALDLLIKPSHAFNLYI
jgi:hypothetical protein